MLVMVKPDFIH